MHAMAALKAHETFASNRARGQVRLAVEAAGETTRRRRVHESGSLRVRFPSAASNELEAVLVNSAGGMAGGDAFDIDIAVGAQARLAVTTAAAEKVYRSLGPDTSIDVRIDVAPGGALAWIPQETILFDNARLTRNIEVDLAEGASLLLVEPLVFGRAGMGEAVVNGALSERWRVRRGGQLIYADGIALDGAVAAMLAEPAAANGGRAIATLLLVPGDEACAEKLRALADRLHGEAGVSSWNGLLVARLCARDGAALRHDLTGLVGVLRDAPLPRLWLN
jgi:urease accessory protein